MNISSEKKQKIDQYKHDLFQNKNFITVTDFGAGSKIFKSTHRKVSKIAKIAGISKKKQELLMQIVAYFKPSNILEIGTSLGIATTSIKFASPHCKITTLEGCPETAKIAKQQFEEHDLKDIKIHIGNFEDTLDNAITSKKFDLIYFDGNHQKESTITYFEKCLATQHNESIFIFDDIHWSKEMKQAWHYIKSHPKVTVTIDVYHFGIVFFRKEQHKEHFIIRA